MKGFTYEKSSKNKLTDSWLTPLPIIKALGRFDLDPCCPKEIPWRTADTMYHSRGLTQPWKGRVWLNPPYGTETGKWLKRLAEHGDGIALIYARTDTRMFHDWAWNHADAMLFYLGRMYFYRLNCRKATASTAPSVFIAYGANNAAALRRCKLKGKYVQLKAIDE